MCVDRDGTRVKEEREWVCLLYAAHALCTRPCPYPTTPQQRTYIRAHTHTHTHERVPASVNTFLDKNTHSAEYFSRFILFLNIIDAFTYARV